MMTYDEAAKQAQERADATGYDYGVERLGGSFRTFMLPSRKNRRGHELRCEVRHCSTWNRIRPGHGPGPLPLGWQ